MQTFFEIGMVFHMLLQFQLKKAYISFGDFQEIIYSLRVFFLH